MSSPLIPGLYHIFSKIRDRPVGRSMLEDGSPFPKRILVLRKPGEILERTIFEFMPTPERDTFHLKCGGAEVGVEDHKLTAFVAFPGKIFDFTVRPQFHLGENVYTIERLEDRTGWVAREEDDTQIEVKPLLLGPSFPPSLFRIVPALLD